MFNFIACIVTTAAVLTIIPSTDTISSIFSELHFSKTIIHSGLKREKRNSTDENGCFVKADTFKLTYFVFGEWTLNCLLPERRKVVIISRNKLILTLPISWCFAPEKQLSNKSAAHLTIWSGITVWLLLFSPGLHHFNKYVNLMKKKLCYRWVFLLHHRKKTPWPKLLWQHAQHTTLWMPHSVINAVTKASTLKSHAFIVFFNKKKFKCLSVCAIINGHAFTDNTLQSACCKNDCQIKPSPTAYYTTYHFIYNQIPEK